MNADLNRRTSNNGFAQKLGLLFSNTLFSPMLEPLQAILGEPYI
jgi:hypothetical protein